MPLVELPPESSPRFPAICARCGAPPSRSYRVCGEQLTADVPLCERCHRRMMRSCAGWVTGFAMLIPFFVVIAALALELVVPMPEAPGPRRISGMIGALTLLALGAGMAWLGLRRRLALHDRFFAPVFALDDAKPPAGYRIVVRSEDFAAALRSLHAGATYRVAPVRVFAPPSLPSFGPGVGLVLVSVSLVIGGLVRFREATSEPTLVLRSIEIFAYGVGGAAGLLAFYLGSAVIAALLGALTLTATRRARDVILDDHRASSGD